VAFGYLKPVVATERFWPKSA